MADFKKTPLGMIPDGWELLSASDSIEINSRITPCLQNGKIAYVQFLKKEQPIGFGSTEFIVLRETDKLSSVSICWREHIISEKMLLKI